MQQCASPKLQDITVFDRLLEMETHSSKVTLELADELHLPTRLQPPRSGYTPSDRDAYRMRLILDRETTIQCTRLLLPSIFRGGGGRLNFGPSACGNALGSP